MGGSAKPRRGRASAAGLQYERRPGRGLGTEGRKARKKGESAFACLLLLLVAGVAVLLALLDVFWGDDTWRWAADTWPGGAYGFAVCLGAAAPCLLALSIWSLSKAGRKSWQIHPARAAGHTLLTTLATASLFPFLSLAFNAMDSGRGRHHSGSPSWAFSHYPWLWILGLASTVGGAVLLIGVLVVVSRRRGTSSG